MSDTFVPRVGAVMSADIAVPEHEREVRFYSQVLTTGDNPPWRDDLMNNHGTPIIGLGAQSPQYADLPLQWMPHIQVADVAASAQRALDLGGKELMHHKDNNGKSQWAVLQDPSGAAFGIMPVVPAELMPTGEESEAAVGRIMWLDLTVPDADTTRDFYAQVVPWTFQNVGMKDGDKQYNDYTMHDETGKAVAGVCHARGGNAGLPPVWLIYLPVGNLAESLGRVEEHGGKIVKASKGKDGSYNYAVVQDPVGVAFALVPA
jgi:predicted enzyme related to lactoylglutathione lyase